MSDSTTESSKHSPQVPRVRLNTTFLDGLRGLAALYVVVHHARYLLHEGNAAFRQHPEQYSAIQKAIFYFLSAFRYGHEGVIFFFVLSGFVIHLRYAQKLAADPLEARFDWGMYVFRRFKRLYPPLVFAILITWGLDRAGMHLGWPVYGSKTPYSLINTTIHPDHSLPTLLGNLVFLIKVYVPAFGTDGPLWSLMYEWWFYMLYPLFWMMSRRSIAGATALMVALFVASYWPAIWPLELARAVFSRMLIWWMGVLLADVYARRIRVPFVYLAPLALLLPVAVVSAGQELLWGLGFCGLIAAGIAAENAGIRLRLLEGLKWLGDMSYTLYVCHMPILVFISGWLMSRSEKFLLPKGFGYLSLGILLAVIFSYLAHFVVEQPFIRKRDSKSKGEEVKEVPVQSLNC